MAGNRSHNFWHKRIRAAAAFLFMLMSVLPSHAGMVVLPAPGTLLPPSAAFAPASLRAITIDAKDPLRFSFLIDRGTQELPVDQKRGEYAQLAKYFLAALTVPDTDQWVNLSPYEGDRLISDQFGMTEMGRDLLAQDYLLKQLTASLMHPDSETGKRFWAAVYEKANKTFGTTDVPLDTFNKVWIIPDNAEVYEKGTSAFLLTQHLQVMTERDYLALRKAQGSSPVDNRPAEQNAELTRITSDAVREIIVPALEKEVNEGQTFAQLRQICSAMILATWYKKALKESFLGQLYADKGKVAGVDQDPKNNEAVFQQYMAAFRKGVVNLIREDYDNYTQELIPRKYFSGGLERDPARIAVVSTPAMLSPEARNAAGSLPATMDQVKIAIHNADTPALARQEVMAEMPAVNTDALSLVITDRNPTLYTDISLQEEVPLWKQGSYNWVYKFTNGDILKVRKKAGDWWLSEKDVPILNGTGLFNQLKKVGVITDSDGGSHQFTIEDFVEGTALDYKKIFSSNAEEDAVSREDREDWKDRERFGNFLRRMISQGFMIRDLFVGGNVMKRPDGSLVIIDRDLLSRGTPRFAVERLLFAFHRNRAMTQGLDDYKGVREKFAALVTQIIKELGVDAFDEKSVLVENEEGVRLIVDGQPLAPFSTNVNFAAFLEEGTATLVFRNGYASGYNEALALKQFEALLPGVVWQTGFMNTPDGPAYFLKARAANLAAEMESVVVSLKSLSDKLNAFYDPWAEGGESAMDPTIKGGIDFNSDTLSLRIKRDGNGVPLPMMQQDLQGLEIRGFVPEVGAITSVPASSFLGDLT